MQLRPLDQQFPEEPLRGNHPRGQQFPGSHSVAQYATASGISSDDQKAELTDVDQPFQRKNGRVVLGKLVDVFGGRRSHRKRTASTGDRPHQVITNCKPHSVAPWFLEHQENLSRQSRQRKRPPGLSFFPANITGDNCTNNSRDSSDSFPYSFVRSSVLSFFTQAPLPQRSKDCSLEERDLTL